MRQYQRFGVVAVPGGLLPRWADSCDPRLPGCHPESAGTGLIVLVLIAFLACLVALVVILTIVFVRRRNAARRGSFPQQVRWPAGPPPPSPPQPPRQPPPPDTTAGRDATRPDAPGPGGSDS